MRIILPIKIAVASVLLKTGPIVRWVTRGRLRKAGVTLDLSDAAIPSRTHAALLFGLYESAERRAIGRAMLGNWPVVELGGSIGYVACLIATRVRPPAQITVEGNPALIPIIRRNLALNGAEHVKVIHGAISYTARSLVEFSAFEDNVAGRLVADAGSPGGSVSRVPALTLGDVLSRQGIDKFSLVCDIEGAELDLLEHEDPAVGARCMQAIFELHPVESCGRSWTPSELAQLVCARWRMQVAHTDSKVWIFRREGVV